MHAGPEVAVVPTRSQDLGITLKMALIANRVATCGVEFRNSQNRIAVSSVIRLIATIRDVLFARTMTSLAPDREFQHALTQRKP